MGKRCVKSFAAENGFPNDFATRPASSVAPFTVICWPRIARAFLYENGVMTDLNSLVQPDSSLDLLLANDINDRDEIVALALIPTLVRQWLS